MANGLTAGRNWLSALGPGILYAAAAIGVSHLVQSTRAGAMYGLSMLGIILFVCVVKYPAIRFGSQYAAATGKSLPENYIEQGWWAIGLYLVTLLLGMWLVLAAISITTAGLAKIVFGLEADDLVVAGSAMAMSALLLIYGRYAWLERIGKLLVVVLGVLVLIATLLAIPRVTWDLEAFWLPELNPTMLFFVVAMAGWMPTPVDGSVMNSVWTSARMREQGRSISPEESRLDFNTGYVAAVFLACCFLILGTAVMFENGVPPETSAGGFAGQVIQLFTQTIGEWSFYLIGFAAFATMFSTQLTVMDVNPRVIVYMTQSVTDKPLSWLYPTLVVIYGAGSLLVLMTLMTSFSAFIDFTTTIGFIAAPIFAILNHRAMLSTDIDEAYQPNTVLRRWSLAGIVVLSTVSIGYFWLLLTA